METEDQTGTSAPKHGNSSNTTTAVSATNADALVAQNQGPITSLADDTCSDEYFWNLKSSDPSGRTHLRSEESKEPESSKENECPFVRSWNPQKGLFKKSKLPKSLSLEALEPEFDTLFKCELELEVCRSKIATGKATGADFSLRKPFYVRMSQIKKTANGSANTAKLVLERLQCLDQAAFLKKSLAPLIKADEINQIPKPPSKIYFIEYSPDVSQPSQAQKTKFAKWEYILENLEGTKACKRRLEIACQAVDELYRGVKDRYAEDPSGTLRERLWLICQEALPSGDEKNLERIRQEQKEFINTLPTSPNSEEDRPFEPFCPQYEMPYQANVITKTDESHDSYILTRLKALKQTKAKQAAFDRYIDGLLEAHKKTKANQAALATPYNLILSIFSIHLAPEDTLAILTCTNGKNSITSLDNGNTQNHARDLQLTNEIASLGCTADVSISADSDAELESSSASNAKYFWNLPQQRNSNGETSCLRIDKKPEKNECPLIFKYDPPTELFDKQDLPENLYSDEAMEWALDTLLACETRINSSEAEKTKTTANRINAKISDQKAIAHIAANTTRLIVGNLEHQSLVNFFQKLSAFTETDEISTATNPPSVACYAIEHDPSAATSTTSRDKKRAKGKYLRDESDKLEGKVEFLREAREVTDRLNQELEDKFSANPAEDLGIIFGPVQRAVLLGDRHVLRKVEKEQVAFVGTLSTNRGDSNASSFKPFNQLYTMLRQDNITKENESYDSLKTMLKEHKQARASLASPCNPLPSSSTSTTSVCAEPCAEDQTGTSALKHDNSSNTTAVSTTNADALVVQNQIPVTSLAVDTFDRATEPAVNPSGIDSAGFRDALLSSGLTTNFEQEPSNSATCNMLAYACYLTNLAPTTSTSDKTAPSRDKAAGMSSDSDSDSSSESTAKYFWEQQGNPRSGKGKTTYLSKVPKENEKSTRVADHRRPQDELFGKKILDKSLLSAEARVEKGVEDLFACNLRIKNLKTEIRRMERTGTAPKRTGKIRTKTVQISQQRAKAKYIVNKTRLALYEKNPPHQVTFLENLCSCFDVDRPAEAPEPITETYYVDYGSRTSPLARGRARELAKREYTQKRLDGILAYLRRLDRACRVLDQLHQKLEGKFAKDPAAAEQEIVGKMRQAALSGSKEELRKTAAAQKKFIDGLSTSGNSSSSSFRLVCEAYKRHREDRIAAREKESYDDHGVNAMLKEYKQAKAALASPCNPLPSSSTSTTSVCAEPCADGKDSIDNYRNQQVAANSLQATNETASSRILKRHASSGFFKPATQFAKTAKTEENSPDAQCYTSSGLLLLL